MDTDSITALRAKTRNMSTSSILPRGDRHRHPIGSALNNDRICCLLSSRVVGDELCYRFPICGLFRIVLEGEHVLMW